MNDTKYINLDMNNSKKPKSSEDKRRTPKESAKKKIQITRTIVITILMFGISIFLIFGKRPTVSQEENRNLAKFPKFTLSSYFNGDYTSAITTFFDDTVPCRSAFKTAITKINSLSGFKYGGENEVQLIGQGMGDNNKNQAADTEPSTEETTAPVDPNAAILSDSTPAQQPIQETTTAVAEETTEEDQNAEGELSNNILIYNKRALMLYGGSFEVGKDFANIVNNYQQSLQGVNVYTALAPTAGTYYIPEEYKHLTNSEPENFRNIYKYLNSNIHVVDVYETLKAHTKEKIYARTDHHWLPLGAFYAAQAFAQTAGVPFASLDTYNPVTYNDYVGSLYGYSQSDIIKDNPEEFTYYEPSNQYSTVYYGTDLSDGHVGQLLQDISGYKNNAYYLVFMGGDDKVTHVHTDCTNGRTLVEIKDSYGNAMVPCLTQSFTDIYVVDMRYFDENIIDFCKAVTCTDLVFAMDSYSVTGKTAYDLDDLYNQTTNIDITQALNTVDWNTDNSQ